MYNNNNNNNRRVRSKQMSTNLILAKSNPLPPNSLKTNPIPGLERPLRVSGGWGYQISRQSAHKGGKVVSTMHRPPLLPGNIPGTHFY
jgi:hypothetical protein